MGLRPADFEMMTAAEFCYAWYGYAESEMLRQRQAWERERWSVWVLTTVQLERKDRRPMNEMFPLPWETAFVPVATTLTMEERINRVKELKRCIEQ